MIRFSIADAMKGVDELFLLIGNVGDELTQSSLPLMACQRGSA